MKYTRYQHLIFQFVAHLSWSSSCAVLAITFVTFVIPYLLTHVMSSVSWYFFMYPSVSSAVAFCIVRWETSTVSTQTFRFVVKRKMECSGRTAWHMHRYQEGDGEEDGKPGGKTSVIEIWKWQDKVHGRDTSKTIPATPCRWLENPEKNQFSNVGLWFTRQVTGATHHV